MARNHPLSKHTRHMLLFVAKALESLSQSWRPALELHETPTAHDSGCPLKPPTTTSGEANPRVSKLDAPDRAVGPTASQVRVATHHLPHTRHVCIAPWLAQIGFEPQWPYGQHWTAMNQHSAEIDRRKEENTRLTKVRQTCKMPIAARRKIEDPDCQGMSGNLKCPEPREICCLTSRVLRGHPGLGGAQPQDPARVLELEIRLR